MGHEILKSCCVYAVSSCELSILYPLVFKIFIFALKFFNILFIAFWILKIPLMASHFWNFVVYALVFEIHLYTLVFFEIYSHALLYISSLLFSKIWSISSWSSLFSVCLSSSSLVVCILLSSSMYLLLFLLNSSWLFFFHLPFLARFHLWLSLCLWVGSVSLPPTVQLTSQLYPWPSVWSIGHLCLTVVSIWRVAWSFLDCLVAIIRSCLNPWSVSRRCLGCVSQLCALAALFAMHLGCASRAYSGPHISTVFWVVRLGHTSRLYFGLRVSVVVLAMRLAAQQEWHTHNNGRYNDPQQWLI